MKWLVGIVAALVLLAIVAVIALPYLVDLPRVQALIATNASQALGRPVTFASMRISALPLPAVELRGLEIGEDPAFGKEPFVRLQRGTVRLKLWPLARAQACITQAVALCDLFLPSLEDMTVLTGLTAPHDIVDWSQRTAPAPWCSSSAATARW